jgi:hypothetical protein
MSVGMRRGGRNAKEIGIVLLGTDTAGHVFSEETRTVVLSRHGAGILSKYRLAPDEILTIRFLGGTAEVAVRLVGEIGQNARGYTYGVAFVDPDLDFWELKFPPTPKWQVSVNVALRCSLCQAHVHGMVAGCQRDADAVFAHAPGTAFIVDSGCRLPPNRTAAAPPGYCARPCERACAAAGVRPLLQRSSRADPYLGVDCGAYDACAGRDAGNAMRGAASGGNRCQPALLIAAGTCERVSASPPASGRKVSTKKSWSATTSPKVDCFSGVEDLTPWDRPLKSQCPIRLAPR